MSDAFTDTWEYTLKKSDALEALDKLKDSLKKSTIDSKCIVADSLTVTPTIGLGDSIMTAIDPTGSIEKKIEELEKRASALEDEAAHARHFHNYLQREEMKKTLLDVLKTIGGACLGEHILEATKELNLEEPKDYVRAAAVRGAQVGAAYVISLVLGLLDSTKSEKTVDAVYLKEIIFKCIDQFDLWGKLKNKI